MNLYGKLLKDGSLHYLREFEAPIKTVWSWIAEGDKRAQWLAGGGDARKDGETIAFVFHHKTLTPHKEEFPERYKAMEDGVSFDVKIARCAPPRQLVILWHAEEGGETEVDFQLTEPNGKTRLDLIQRGQISDAERISAAAGWHTHLNIMADKLAGAEPAPFWSTHQALMKDYAERFSGGAQ